MKFLIVSAFLLVSTLVFADWQVLEKKEAATELVTKLASVTNESGHTFSVYRISNQGPVWANFTLSSSVQDQVSVEPVPIYRVDKYEPKQISYEKRLNRQIIGVQSYEWNPQWVSYLIWHGQEKEGISNSIIQFMGGENLVFRYHFGTEGFKETSFTLKGASSAIASALGINEKIDRVREDKITEYKKELVAQVNKCREDFNTICLLKVTECAKKSNQDTQVLKLCVEK
jgi:hypothetical protein